MFTRDLLGDSFASCFCVSIVMRSGVLVTML